jgi:hypothetical protein
MPARAIWKRVFLLPDYTVRIFLKLAGKIGGLSHNQKQGKTFTTMDVYITTTAKCLMFIVWIALLSRALAYMAIELRGVAIK